MSWRDPAWRYTPASETEKPGYLQRRFAEIRRRQKLEEKERERQEQQTRETADVVQLNRR
jgi:hypothetical protein